MLMDYNTTKYTKILLSNSLLIMIIIGIILLVIGDKETDLCMGCFLIITGVLLYYLLEYLVVKPNCFHKNDMIDINDFDL